jgi:hypothetical protein
LSAHSPKPWKVDDGQQGWSNEDGSIETVLDAEGSEVAQLCTGSGKADTAFNLARIKADARLLAAAPDLLESAEADEYAAALEAHHDSQLQAKVARERANNLRSAAIAKAGL